MRGKRYAGFAILMMLVLSSQTIVASDLVDLEIVTTTGTIVKKHVSKDITNLEFSNDDSSPYQFASVCNLDVLPHLKSITLMNIGGITDYTFLHKAKGLTDLYIGSCTVRDLRFLESMENLEWFEMGVFIPANLVEKVRSTPIDLGRLERLKYIGFCYYIGFPHFINVKNKPFIELNNNRIERLTSDEIKLLHQFSYISLIFNPIADNPVERNKLKDLNVWFDEKDFNGEIQAKYLHKE